MAWLGATGCAGAAVTHPSASPSAHDVAVARLLRGSEEQERRISELEARLALLEQEARDTRESAANKRTETTHETMHVGSRQRDVAPEIEEPSPAPVIVRLHETPPPTPTALALPPAASSLQLGVAPLPEERAGKLTQPSTSDAAGRDDYRDALRFLGERRYDAALTALNRLLVQDPSGPLAASATYWRGEVRYAARKYADALVDFEALLARFPESSKAADALLKVGMCHLRLGDQTSAERYFQKVREQYPKSDAARIASREGSS